MLVDLMALLAFVTGYQLDLRVGQAFGGQADQHWVPEQVPVQRLPDPLRCEPLAYRILPN